MLAEDDNPVNSIAKESTATISAGAWKFLVYSFVLVDSKDKEVEFWVDNVAETKQTYTDIF